jgi:aminopeptidase YwaD
MQTTLFSRTLLFILLGVLAAPAFADAPSIELLQQLADPALEGRGVGTKGLDKARDLLVGRLTDAKITPVFPGKDPEKDGPTYLQDFTVFVGNELLDGNQFAGSGPEDFIPLAFSSSGSLGASSVVFAGFGISVRQGAVTGLTYDDYDGLDVHGKIVIALLGDPGTGNRDSLFRNPNLYSYSTPMYKVQNAALHGAAAIVLVRDPLSLSGSEPPLHFLPTQGGGATAELLAGQATEKFVESLMGRSLLDLQQQIAASQKPNSFELTAKATMNVSLRRDLGTVQNVVGVLPGKDPAVAKEYLVLGAHYDHLGYGGDNALDPENQGKVHPGADDNASGVQAVYDLAKRIQAAGGGRHPLLVAFFSAEEEGLLGSKFFTDSLPLPEGAKVTAMLNLDMVGRLQDNKLSVLASDSAKEFPALVDQVNAGIGFTLVKGDTGFGSSDHASFLQLKIPTLFFTTGAEPDYHRATDTADKINIPGMAKVEDYVFASWQAVDAMPAPPTYDPASETPNQPPRQGRGYGSYFGSIPEFDGNETRGVLLQGVRPGSPAESAGLRAADILTGMGEIKVGNLQDLVFALRYYRPNEEVVVSWLRNGVQMSGKCVLRDRDAQ